MSDPESELTIRSAAKILGVTARSVRAAIERGEIRARRTFTGRFYVPRAEVCRLQQQEQQSQQERR